jgi:hypothetical protein
MEKLDLRKQYKELYLPSAKQVSVVKAPSLKFAMVDGAIEPGCTPGTSPSFQQAMEALYGISYTLKFMSKLRQADPVDYTVMALEGLWWIQDGEFDIRQPGNWLWTVMIMQPDHITPKMFREALAQLRKKKPGPALDKLRLETFREGLCVQIMHLGPYAGEPATVDKLHAFAAENGLRDLVGRGDKHHEIYLGDPRKAAPSRLKTVLRHPVEKVK